MPNSLIILIVQILVCKTETSFPKKKLYSRVHVCVCVERERERESFLHLIELFVDLVDLFEISKELTNDGPIG